MRKIDKPIVWILVIIIFVFICIFSFKRITKNTKENILNLMELHINNEHSENAIKNFANTIEVEKDQLMSVDSNTSLIPLNIIRIEKIDGGELLYINDYKLIIEKELVEKGYSTSIENNILTINSKDNSYKCIILQLSDNYIMPTEEEIEAFYETDEYKKWDNEEYDYKDKNSLDLHMEKYDKISTEYYKKLGYTVKNSPNYVLTEKEMLQKIEEYLLEGEKRSSGSNGLFPGYEYYNYYDWGKTTLYTIPKYYKDKTFGEKTSDFSACIYCVEYKNSSYGEYVDLWTL